MILTWGLNLLQACLKNQSTVEALLETIDQGLWGLTALKEIVPYQSLSYYQNEEFIIAYQNIKMFIQFFSLFNDCTFVALALGAIVSSKATTHCKASFFGGRHLGFNWLNFNERNTKLQLILIWNLPELAKLKL